LPFITNRPSGKATSKPRPPGCAHRSIGVAHLGGARTPLEERSNGVGMPRPPGRTLRLASWKSQCHSPCTCATSRSRSRLLVPARTTVLAQAVVLHEARHRRVAGQHRMGPKNSGCPARGTSKPPGLRIHERVRCPRATGSKVFEALDCTEGKAERAGSKTICLSFIPNHSRQTIRARLQERRASFWLGKP
jgi:hypothetical protein